jgi:hypothetical protein
MNGDRPGEDGPMEPDARRSLHSAAPLVALIIVAAACGDNLAAPAEDGFDVERLRDDFAAVPIALEANTDLTDDVGHVTAVLDTLTAAGWILAPGAVAVSPDLLSVRGFEAVGPARSRASTAPPLPVDLLGMTFEWGAAGDGYAVTERTGAPPDGIRFILYDRTTTPLVENGLVDLTDESGASSDRLGVRLLQDGITRLDYDVEVKETTNADSTSIAGFVTDGFGGVDFEAVQVVSSTDEGFQVDLDYALSLASRSLVLGLDYVLNLSLIAPDSRFTATFDVGPDRLVLDLTQDAENAIDGTVTWNGEIVMTVVDDGAGQPSFLGPEGQDLAAPEAAAMRDLFEFASEGLGLLLPYLILPSDDAA